MSRVSLNINERVQRVLPLRGDIISNVGNGWVEYKSGKIVLIRKGNNPYQLGDQVQRTKIKTKTKLTLWVDIIHKSGKIIRLRKIFFLYERKVKLCKIDPSLK